MKTMQKGQKNRSGRKYTKPPIIEAACEFSFDRNQVWDWTIPGLMYQEIKNEFPKKRQQNLFQMEVLTQPVNVEQNLTGGIARMQFLREDEKIMIQVAPYTLAINHLKPYTEWETYQPLIKKALKAYRQIGTPKALSRIGLRYINRIDIPETIVKIQDYLTAVPVVPKNIPQHFEAWVQSVELPFPAANGKLVLQSGTARAEDHQGISFMLDLDFRCPKPNEIALDNAIEWIELAHQEIENVFEACITDKSRELFQEGVTNA